MRYCKPASLKPNAATTVQIMRILAAAILFSIISARAFGMDCADQTQFGLDKCADASFQRADRALNDAYREVLRRLDGDEHQKRLLAAAETAWIDP